MGARWQAVVTGARSDVFFIPNSRNFPIARKFGGVNLLAVIMQANPDSARHSWTRHTRRIARKVNLGWWLETLSTPLVIAGLAGACALLLLRRQMPEATPLTLGAATAGAVLLIAVVAWLIARRRFETPEQSMVRIEASMKLRNGLSAARAGVAPWPEAPAKVDAGIDWRWQRVLVPPLAALGFLGAGLFLPVSTGAAAQTGRDEPLSWQKIEADLERLAQEDVIDETYIEETRKRLEELRKQEEEEWFSHSSLEATDSLKKQHASEIQRLERELGRADQALGQLQKNAGGMPQAEKERLLNQFDQALQGLQNGALKPNPQLLEQLKQLDPNNLGQLNPEQLQQLRENLQKGGKACKDCQGGGDGDDWLDELLDGNGQDGNGQDGNDREGEGPGKGDANRGPGHSPGVLGKEGPKVDTGDLTGLEAKDLSRALPGDLLQLQDGEHEVDRTATGPQAGGGVDATGAGGDRVWRDSLDPSEQKALKRFFE